jgi:chorismate-pyruvate lyase
MLNAYYAKRGVEPVYAIFRSRGFSANWEIEGTDHENIPMAALPPFLRTLLLTDGTVTKSLEAFYWESIEVETVSQAVVRAEADIEWLDVGRGEEVIGRRVNLRGRTSGVLYTRANSLIRPLLIPEALRGGLMTGSLGIGELIRDCGLETYRELLEIGVSGPMPASADADVAAGAHIHRTYRIVVGGTPAILITEYFPLALFSSGGHGASSVAQDGQPGGV